MIDQLLFVHCSIVFFSTKSLHSDLDTSDNYLHVWNQSWQEYTFIDRAVARIDHRYLATVRDWGVILSTDTNICNRKYFAYIFPSSYEKNPDSQHHHYSS